METVQVHLIIGTTLVSPGLTSLQNTFPLTLSGPAFSVVRQARGGLRGPDAKNQG